MADIHKNWLIHEHVDDARDDLVEKAKTGKRSPKPATEKAVKPKPETRGKDA